MKADEVERGLLDDRHRYDVALVVDDVEPAGEIGRFVFPPMRVAEVVLSGGIELEARAIDWLYQTWLPRSGFVPEPQPHALRDGGLTIVTTMHDLTLAGQYADRLVLLDRGEVVAEGAPAEVLSTLNVASYYGANVRVVHDEAGVFVLPLRR